MNPVAKNDADNGPVIREGREKRMNEAIMAAIESQAWPSRPWRFA